MGNEKLIYDLSLLYAQEILHNRPEEKDCIPEMNELLLRSFHQAHDYFSSLSEEEFESLR